ncbi:hypothetical protein [Bradyrhizobium glycinis]|uniref:hypothetical protein n=1 Tax=Bradyrhizobium glycinis TaxID=2751812 RepID=UPI0018D5D383|nr:hypothetical protein [Bradyrhizobium glycinis]MBH5369028.1 hypothetical protein [Bradyrhizobium glycinis]
MLHLAISAVLVWLAINIAFVVLRLRATPDAAAPRIDRSSRRYPGVVPVHHRLGQ